MLDTLEIARAVRCNVLQMVHKANVSHVGACFSCADILAVLYGRVLRVDPDAPDAPDRDYFIMSKGHAAAALYSTLAVCDFFPSGWLDEFCCDGARLGGHVTSSKVPGVEFSSGSLGHGLSFACGVALGRRNQQVFALLGDGELNEGAVWEAIMFAGHHGQENLTAVVDVNGLQGFGNTEEVLDMHPLEDKFTAFGWDVASLDGHDHEALFADLSPKASGKPRAILAHTVKGKGVSFMENQLAWHYKSPNVEQLALAKKELGCD